jgi:hypothetical protein
MGAKIVVKPNGQTLRVTSSASYWTTEALALVASASDDIVGEVTTTSDITMWFANAATTTTIDVTQPDGTSILSQNFPVDPGVGPRTLNPGPDEYKQAADLTAVRRGGYKRGGTYWFNTLSQTNSATAAIVVDTLYLGRWHVPNDITIDRIGGSVTGAGGAGSVVRIGIYNDSLDLPGTVFLDAGTIDGTSATVQSITLSPTINIPAGNYWIGGVNQVGTAATVTTCAAGTAGEFPVPRTTAPTAGQAIGAVTMTSVSGALATFVHASVSSATNLMRVHVRVV